MSLGNWAKKQQTHDDRFYRTRRKGCYNAPPDIKIRRDMLKCVTINKYITTPSYKEEMGLKVDCFVGYFHHSLMTMSAITYVYCYPLFESGEPSLYIE